MCFKCILHRSSDAIQQFYHNVDTVGAGDNFKARIDVLAVEETVAVVRVLEEGWGGRIDFTLKSKSKRNFHLHSFIFLRPHG